MKLSKIFLLTITIMILSSCSTLKEGFKNQKKNSNEEFLVEKKLPLVMPPDFNDLPIPQNENNENNASNENEIKKLILKKKDDGLKKNISKKNKTFEDSFLKKIKEN